MHREGRRCAPFRMRGRTTLGLAVSLAMLAGLLVGGAAWWRIRVLRAPSTEVTEESWHHVQDMYPTVQDAADGVTLSTELIKEVVRANPFTPERRLVPPPERTETAGGVVGSGPAPGPMFAYKGRVNLGARQRAIIEHLATHKTYFLEVGQEVAGFKLLDIQESQVVLSEPQTHEAVAVTLTSAALPSAHPADRGPGRQAGSP